MCVNIVIIEDNEGCAEILTHTLTKLLNNDVAVVVKGNGREAFNYLTTLDEAPHLILLDINLPDMDGFAILQAARGMDVLRQAPVVVMSSVGTHANAERSRRLGANGFMTKTGSLAELRRQLQNFTHHCYGALSPAPLPA